MTKNCGYNFGILNRKHESNYMSFERARRVESKREKIFVRTHTGAEI